MKNKNIDGDAVPKDPVKAFEWYLKAAEQGDAHAQRRVFRTMTPV